MKHIFSLVALFFVLIGFSQSDDCNTATPIALSGTTCVSGSTAGAQTTTYSSHPCYPTNQAMYVVFYTFVADNPNVLIEVTGTGANPAAEVGMVVSTQDCAAGLWEDCEFNGNNYASSALGYSVGQTVLLAVTTNTAPGDFEVCITSSPASTGLGNICSNPVIICSKDPFDIGDMTIYDASGTTPSCFPLPTNRDIYFQFTVTVSGSLAWQATPFGTEPTEFDWAVYQITASCTGNEVACNYNYASATQASSSFGMVTGAVGDQGLGLPEDEFNPPINVTAGETYVIYIDNFSNAGAEGFTFEFLSEMTAEISPTADFSLDPSTPICGGQSQSVSFTNTTTGVNITEDWDFGNGNTFSGSNPPAETYNSPGTYPVTLSVDDGNCTSVHTEYVQVLNEIVTSITEDCNNGTADVEIAGGMSQTDASTYTISNIVPATASVSNNTPVHNDIITLSGLNNNDAYSFDITDANGCTASISGTYVSCVISCPADAGTSAGAVNGQSTSSGLTYNLCYNDELVITPNGDAVFADESTDATANGITFDPGMWLAAFSCPPSVAPPNDITNGNDPCFLGMVYYTGTWSLLNDVGDNSTVYYVPITGYSETSNIYAVAEAATPTEFCYDLGEVYEVNYLSEVTYSIAEDCATNSANITVTGGLAAFDGSNYTISNLLPATASLSATSIADGGTVTISGLNQGDNYSIDVVDGTGCALTISGGPYTGVDDASFSYPKNTYCLTEPNPIPTITGVSGGAFSMDNSGVIDVTTGVIDLASSGIGSFVVTYTTLGACAASEVFAITITAADNASFTMDDFCQGSSLGGYNEVTAGGTYSFTNATSNGEVIDATTGVISNDLPGTYDITYTTTGACSSTSNVLVTVHELPNAVLSGGSSACNLSGVTDLSIAITGGIPDYDVTLRTPTNTENLTLTQQNSTYTPLAFGDYEVTNIVDGNGCVSSAVSSQSVSQLNAPVFTPPSDMTFCNTEAVNGISLDNASNNPDGANLTWSISPALTGLAASGATDIPAFVAENNGSTNVTYTVTVTPEVNGCVGTPESFTMTIISTAVPSIAAIDTVGCAPLLTTFQSSILNGSCSWEFSDGTTASGCEVVKLFGEGGVFGATLTVSDNGCSVSVSLDSIVRALDVPEAQFSTNPVIIYTDEPQQVRFTNQSRNADTYTWFFGDGYGSNDVSPTHTYESDDPDTIAVVLIAENELGCSDTALGNVIVLEQLIMYVPNTFTPNGDSYNNTFKPILTQGFDPQEYTLYVFNRWGDLVFESHNADIGWDGTFNNQLVHDGVYVWRIELYDTGDQEYKNFAGHITLLR